MAPNIGNGRAFVPGRPAGGALGLPRVIGHRGSAVAAPENTLAAFRAAAAMGAAMVEFDVQLTADGHAVVIHDDTLERTTDGTGRVGDTRLDDLRRLDAGGWFEPQFAGERVPTLAEAMAYLAEAKVRANIELKTGPGREDATAQAAIAAAEVFAGDKPPPLLSSFSARALVAARRLKPDWPRGLLVDRLPADWQEAAVALGVGALHCHQRHLSPVVVDEAHRLNLAVLAFTVNEAERARTLWGWGVDAIITDQPDVLLGALA